MKYLWNRYTKFILTIIIFFCSAFFQLIPVKLFNINNITPKIQILLTLFSNMMNILLLVLMYYKDLKEDFKVFLENKKEMLEALGLEESGLDKVIKSSYDLLGLMSFLTAGEPEVRAWTIKIWHGTVNISRYMKSLLVRCPTM